MFSIVFICPYFGKLPKGQFPLWLKSCENNPTIDWIIFTDDRTKYNYPKNVKVKYIEFKDFKQKLQEKFNFKLNIKDPYKLCDFKPTYGYVFYEYIKQYDFWGHCDISDTIFGQLRNFLTTENLIKADKIMQLGHMTLYRNNKEVNSRFMLQVDKKVSLEKILGVEENKFFDEFYKYGINNIYLKYEFPVKIIDNMYMDIAPLSWNFKIHCVDKDNNFNYPDKNARCFEWKQGKLFVYEMKNKLYKKEIGYLHFQKRKMKRKASISTESFFIVPNQFIEFPSGMNQNIFNKYTNKCLINSTMIGFILKTVLIQVKMFTKNFLYKKR